jgi:OHCU decarboxylase
VITLAALNHLSADEFVEQLGGIFEHSSWVAQRALARRPFGSRRHLLNAMQSVVEAASAQEQLALINAHPKLGARSRSRQGLTQASAIEQRGAGLDACTPQEYAHLEQINAAYMDRFGFPFILAVRGHDPQSIIANCEQRLHHERAQEIRTALEQIGRIAGFRLESLIDETAAAG